MKKLEGLNIVYFEARHSKTLGDLIAVQGGTPFAAPAMKEVPLENNKEALVFAEKLFNGEIDVLVLLTGVGAKTLMAALEPKYGREKILSALKRIAIVPRGPKPIRVLNEWGVPYAATVPEPNTWRELLGTLDSEVPVSGKSVAFQEYGVTNPELLEGLEKRGARLMRVPVYRWALPDDIEPLKVAISKIIAGEMHVAMFTTAVQVEHLFQVAEQMAVGAAQGRPQGSPLLREALNKIVIASVGPDCSEVLRGHGLRVDIQPESPKMGPLVVETAEKARSVLAALR